jgi:hypothetical protein
VFEHFDQIEVIDGKVVNETMHEDGGDKGGLWKNMEGVGRWQWWRREEILFWCPSFFFRQETAVISSP